MTQNTRPWRQIRRDPTPEARARVDEIKRGMEAALALAELRDRLELTQAEVASRMGIDQPGISRLERRDDLYLSTLREYVTALGGDLELVARFPDGQEITVAPARQAMAVG